MGALSLLLAWVLYRRTELLAQLPFSRWLDWCAERAAPLARQPWLDGLGAALLLAAVPAALTALALGLLGFARWPLEVAVLLLCMGPMRLLSPPADASGESAPGLASSLSPRRYHALAARDVVGALVWAALLGAPGAVFYRAARELAESPVAALSGEQALSHAATKLFGVLFWLPARLYGVALIAAGSGGRLPALWQFDADPASADALVHAASAEPAQSQALGPRAMLIASLCVATLVFIF